MKKQIFLLLVGTLVIVLLLAVAIRSQKSQTYYPTYFKYAENDISKLSQLKTKERIDLYNINFWDNKAFELVSENKIGDVDASRIYAYLAVSQHDFAHLSLSSKGDFMGNINSISQAVLCKFFPDDCEHLELENSFDDFSRRIVGLVMNQVEARMSADQEMTKPYLLNSGSNLWSGPSPQIGLDAGSRKTWNLNSSDQFRAPSPPHISSDATKSMLQEVKIALKNITPDQRQKVVFWAGGPGTKTPPGIWLSIANQYMNDQKSSIQNVLDVRLDITTAMADAVISVFDSKYTYQQKRPFMLDSSIITVMPTPNHPSYPAGHATISGAAYAVLAHHFPESKESWKSQAEEAAVSRLWGGIHFSIDNTAGLEQGKKVGEKAAKRTLQ